MFPGIGPRRYTVVAKSSEHIVDDCNQARDRCLQEWWDGETYFDLGGRDKLEFERAVAATRKGKPVRNKSEAKKEVKQSKFITTFARPAGEARCHDKTCYQSHIRHEGLPGIVRG